MYSVSNSLPSSAGGALRRGAHSPCAGAPVGPGPARGDARATQASSRLALPSRNGRLVCNASSEPSVRSTLDDLSRVLGVATPEEEAAEEAEKREREEAKEASRSRRASSLKSADEELTLEKSLLIAWYTVPTLPVLGVGGTDRGGARGDRPDQWLDQRLTLRTNQGGGGGEEDGMPGGTLAGAAPGALQQLPIIPFPHPGLPDSHIQLNLYEPRWLTLFSHLLEEDGDPKGVIAGASGTSSIRLAEMAKVRAYEKGAAGADDVEWPMQGKGRVDEAQWAGSRRFGVSWVEGNKVASVGAVFEVVGWDVLAAAPILKIVAKGRERFEIVRVRQEVPYLVADVELLEGPADVGAGDPDVDVIAARMAEMMGRMRNEAQPPPEAALDGADGQPTPWADRVVHQADPQAHQGRSLFWLASVLLRTRPSLAQRVMDAESAADMAAVLDAVLDRIDLSLKLGLGSWSGRNRVSVALLAIGLVLLFVAPVLMNGSVST